MSNNPASKKEWHDLIAHRDQMESTSIAALFSKDKNRFSQFSLNLDNLLFDYSKNRITKETVQKLTALAKAQDLEEWRDRMFAGDAINTTEKRAVLHTALRRPAHDTLIVDGENVISYVHDVLLRMKKFSDAVRAGEWRGYTGKPLRYIVNIGIGGSDLGPSMACKALKPFIPAHIEMHFVSNIDGTHLCETLNNISAEETLFIIASKTFTTQETIANAVAAKEWIIKQLGNKDAVNKHFCALSTNIEAATDFGILEDSIFPFKDWVGGRYSLWSAIGLSICIALGHENFEKFLGGAYLVDRHFQEAPLGENIPVLMALISIWNRNFWNCSSQAILPYDQYLQRFPAFLQQMDMESNGKSVDRDGFPITDYKTGTIIFGEPGTNGQHAFYQLIHQGTDIIPCDFIAPKKTHNPVNGQHELLLNNMLAQAQALMQGRSVEEADGNIFRRFEGNRPSNIFLFDEINPKTLGMLIALYEHKVFAQGIIWNINSFDQYGVELGKELASKIGSGDAGQLDSSTNGLLNSIKI
jgi:glucose-6-phosphate isomerase